MAEDRLDAPHAHPARDIALSLGSDHVAGLGPEQVSERRVVHGPNQLLRQKPKSWLAILAHQFASLIVWLLAGAAALSFAFGDLAEGVAIVVVLLINGAIGFVTEVRAARSMEALMRLGEVRTRVRRQGRETMVDARDLVPGDVVVLEAGDIITADLRLSQASGLEIDESVLTGEAVAASKSGEPVEATAALGDRRGMAFKGTAVTRGVGEGLVVATGMKTEIGRISSLAQSAEGETPPLERRLDRLGHRLVWLTFVLAALTIGAGILQGHDVVMMIQTGVALAVAAVPEGLPVVATLSLARGMWRMSRRNAVITRLSSVETLGATTIILTDKTGTLTENRMTVVRYLLDGEDADVEDGVTSLAPGSPLSWAMRLGALCNDAELGDGSAEGRAGDPMELALLSVAASSGISRGALTDELPEIREYAFDPVEKMMATVHADGDTHLFAVKGAPEAVIDRSERVLGPGGARPLTDDERRRWHDRSAAAAGDGLRLLGIAMKHDGAADADPYAGLTLVGLVCMLDPVRDDVPDAIRASRAAGVRVIMVTGDHARTARTIAREAGLGDGELTVIEGRELVGLDPETASAEMRDRILAADVFARVTPEAKLVLVSMFQKAGHVVAMTGDGVNDAPALKKADIGVAMGLRGTQVAQQAAHMVLRDDRFATIISAMRQGRVIFNNIRRFVVYLMSCNVSEVLIVGLAVGAGLPIPLLPLQILFLNLVTDVFPAFALGLGRGDGTVMRKPPRDPAEPILDRRRWVLIGVLGGAITLATLSAFLLALHWLKLDPHAAVTVAFLTLALAQLWNVFNVRDRQAGVISNDVTRNPYVWGAITLCLGLTALAIWLPPLSDILGLPDPGPSGLALGATASLMPLILGQLWLAVTRSGVTPPEAA